MKLFNQLTILRVVATLRAATVIIAKLVLNNQSEFTTNKTLYFKKKIKAIKTMTIKTYTMFLSMYCYNLEITLICLKINNLNFLLLILYKSVTKLKQLLNNNLSY